MYLIRYLTKSAINSNKYNHLLNNRFVKTINSQNLVNSIDSTHTYQYQYIHTNHNEFDDETPKKGYQKSLKRHPSRDRTELISVETSIRYMNSKAYENTYHHYSVWHLHRRTFKGQFSPVHPRVNCVTEDGFLSSGNPCPICRDKYLILHYTNLDLLKQFIDEHTGYLYPNTYVCLCFKQYENLCVAYTLAKEYGLISFQLPFREYNYSVYYPQHVHPKQTVIVDLKSLKTRTKSVHTLINYDMDNIANVDIDNSGRFKYVLIKIMDGNNGHKFIVRGYAWASYHSDIVDSLEPQFVANKLKYECIGGGRIIHNPQHKTIKVFGYSQGFGKADHSISCRLLNEHFKDYKSIEWSDDGY